MGSGFSKMKKQAKMMQDQLADMQKQMNNTKVIGKAGNGLVKITLNGNKEIQALEIHPDCVNPEDIEGLQDLIIAAQKDATRQLEDNSSSGSMENLRNFSFPFS